MADAHGEWVLQRSPGVYDEAALAALDFVVAEAGRAGVRLVLSLVDNWSYYGGVDEFVDWSGSVPPRDARYPRIARAGDASSDAFHSAQHQAYEAERHALFFSDLGCRWS